jgi:hypothetical protein
MAEAPPLMALNLPAKIRLQTIDAGPPGVFRQVAGDLALPAPAHRLLTVTAQLGAAPQIRAMTTDAQSLRQIGAVLTRPLWRVAGSESAAGCAQWHLIRRQRVAV